MRASLLQRSFLEAAGTALLSYSIARAGHASLDSFQQAWLIGLTVCLLIHTCGRLSGAHFNPAVSLLLHQQRHGWRGLLHGEGARETLCYSLAQILGALLAFRLDPWLPTDATVFRLEAFVPELIFSAVLLFLIQAWSHEGRICPFAQPLAGVVIGSGLVVLVLLGGLTGSGIYNPAIALAMAWTRGVAGITPLIFAQLLAVPLVISLGTWIRSNSEGTGN
jgi:glycerol uptake facilitator-like aquaporin